MKYSIVLAALFIVLISMGCASKPVPIEPSFYLLSTNKAATEFLNEMADELKSNRYEVESLDLNLGLLVMAPRRFVIVRDEQRTYGEQSLQLRQEGGSVKLRITYLCEYETGKSECMTDDDYANDKIRRIERLMMSMINRKLYKKRGEQKSRTKDF